MSSTSLDPGEMEVGSGAPIRDPWDSLATGHVHAPHSLQHQHQHQQPQASSKMTTPLATAKCEAHDVRAELELPKPPSVQLPSKKLFPFKGSPWGVGIPPASPNHVSIGLLDSLEVPTPTTKKISLSYKAVGKDKSPAHPSPPPSQVPHQHHAENVAGLLDTLLSTAVSCVVDKHSSLASASVAEAGGGGAAMSSHNSKKLASAGEAVYGMHASQHLGKPLAGMPPWKAEGVFYESDHAYFEQQQQHGLLPYSMSGTPVAVCSASADCPSPPLYSPNKPSTGSMTTPAKASLLPSATSMASRLRQPPPPPPPYPWDLKLTTWSQRRSPLYAFQSVVKKMMLGLPVSPRESFCREMVHLLNKACSLRHIATRKPAPTTPGSITAGAENGRGREEEEREVGEEEDLVAAIVVAPDVVDVSHTIVWMEDGDGCGRHEKTGQVISLVLEYLTCIHAEGAEVPTSHELLGSSLLPCVEELLTVGIEEMESDVCLFRQAISLLYALSKRGDAATLFGAIGNRWIPHQSRSVLSLSGRVDNLVSEYLGKMGGCGESDGDGEDHEAFFWMVRHVVHTVREVCGGPWNYDPDAEGGNLPASMLAAAAAGGSAEAFGRGGREVGAICASTGATGVEVAEGAIGGNALEREGGGWEGGGWRSLPSVVCWAMRGRGKTDDELDKEYEEVMGDIKVEAVEGLLDNHFFKSNAASGGVPSRTARKLMQELVALRRDLPLNRREAVVLRFDEERADFIKVVVFGSQDTPYAAGAFEYHVWCPPSYPQVAPNVWLITTGTGRIRFNPNLYEDGLVCSSLLNQGSGWGHVTWRSGDSNLLEVFKSIMWVHMTQDVYYAEPDQEDMIGTPEGEAANEAYCDIVRYGNVRYAMVGQLRRPPSGFEDAVRAHFRIRGPEILAMLEGWLETARMWCPDNGGDLDGCHHMGMSDEDDDVDMDMMSDDCYSGVGVGGEDGVEEEDEEEEEEEGVGDEELADEVEEGDIVVYGSSLTGSINEHGSIDTCVMAQSFVSGVTAEGGEEDEEDEDKLYGYHDVPTGPANGCKEPPLTMAPPPSSMLSKLSIGTNHQPVSLLPQSSASQQAMSLHDGAHLHQDACGALEEADGADGEGKGEHSVVVGSWIGSAEADGTQMLVNCVDDHDHDEDEDEDEDEDALRVARRQTGPPRFPVPNYRAEFVQSHNPDIADRFDMGYYRLDLERAVNELRAELAKLH